MKGIEINGEKLHEVGMHLEPDWPGTMMTLRYPKSRIHYVFGNEDLLIEVPALLAVELYRKGVLPQSKDTPITVKESGKPKGSYSIQTVIYPKDPGKDTVRITFQKK